MMELRVFQNHLKDEYLGIYPSYLACRMFREDVQIAMNSVWACGGRVFYFWAKDAPFEITK